MLEFVLAGGGTSSSIMNRRQQLYQHMVVFEKALTYEAPQNTYQKDLVITGDALLKDAYMCN